MGIGDNKTDYSRKYYLKNREKIRSYQKIYRLKPENKEKENQRKRINYKTNPKIRERVTSYFKKYYYADIELSRLKSREKHLKVKIEVLNFYSKGTMKCSCCGENIIEFLSIDHIEGEGNKHRKNISTNIYYWLKKMKFPPGFQVHCFNCNLAKGFFGVCPHKKQKGSA